jgi:hypothetical protein
MDMSKHLMLILFIGFVNPKFLFGGVLLNTGSQPILVFSDDQEQHFQTKLTHFLQKKQMNPTYYTFETLQNTETNFLPFNLELVHLWKNNFKKIESDYFTGNFNTLLSRLNDLEHDYPLIPLKIRHQNQLSILRLKALCYRALTQRVLKNQTAYQKTIYYIASHFPSSDLLGMDFPDDFIKDINNQRLTEDTKLSLEHQEAPEITSSYIWTEPNLPIDHQYISPPLNQNHRFKHDLIQILKKTSLFYPDISVWVFKVFEKKSTAFCFKKSHRYNWHCLNQSIYTHELSMTLPFLYQHTVKTPLMTQEPTLVSARPSPLSNNIPIQLSQNWFKSIPWWAWAGGVLVIGTTTVYLMTSTDSEPTASPKGTLRW